MGRWTGWVVGLVAVLLGVGCGSPKSDSDQPEPVSHLDGEVSIEVESHNWSDVVIYLVRGGVAERLGMVTSLSTGTFVFPFRRLGTSGSAQLHAYPIGGPAGFTSETLTVQPGQMIKWTLENDLDRSSLAVY